MIEEIAPVAYAAASAASAVTTDAQVPAWASLSQGDQEGVAEAVEAVLDGSFPLDGEPAGSPWRVFAAVVRAMSAGHPLEELLAA